MRLLSLPEEDAGGLYLGNVVNYIRPGKRFLIKLKRAVYKSCVRPGILHINEALCMK